MDEQKRINENLIKENEDLKKENHNLSNNLLLLNTRFDELINNHEKLKEELNRELNSTKFKLALAETKLEDKNNELKHIVNDITKILKNY